MTTNILDNKKLKENKEKNENYKEKKNDDKIKRPNNGPTQNHMGSVGPNKKKRSRFNDIGGKKSKETTKIGQTK